MAVVDAGIANHPDLASKLLPGCNFVSNPQDPNPGPSNDPSDVGGATDFHGSHVAGTIGAATNNGRGVAGVS